MKYLKTKGILCVVVALLLTAALAVVYGHFGLQTDINEVRKQCNLKMNSLTTSITGLMKSQTLVNYEYEDILYKNACLNALPLRETVRQKGDGAIATYDSGCVLRLEGDRLILPEDGALPVLEASSFRDPDNQAQIGGCFYTTRSETRQDDESIDPEEMESWLVVCAFCQLQGDYYYLESTPALEMQEFLNERGSFTDTVANLEKVYGGYIVTFNSDSPEHFLIYESEAIGDEVNTVHDLGIDPDAGSDGVDIIRVGGKRCVYAISEPVHDDYFEISQAERIALIVPIENLDNRRIPRLVISLCVSLLFLLTAIVWVMSGLRVFRRPAITVQQRKQYGPERMRRILVAIGLAGVLAVGLMTFFINCLLQLYAATQNNLSLLERINAVASETQSSTERAKARQNAIYVGYARSIADLLAEYPRLKTPEALEEMSRIVQADYLMVYDDQGREVMSNAPYVNLAFSRDTQDSSYEFRLLLTGVSSVVQDVSLDEQTRLERQRIGVCMDDGNTNDGYGALVMAVLPNERYRDTMTIDQLMQTMTPADGLCLALDPETGDIRHSSDADLVNANALNLGMTQQDLQGGIMDHFLLNGQRWYSCTDSIDDMVYHSAVRADAVYRRLPVTALLFSACFLVAYALLALLLMLGYTERGIDGHGPQVVEDDEVLAQVGRPAQRNGGTRLDVVMEHLRTTHFGQTPEQKTRFAFSLIAGMMLLVMLVALQLSAVGQNRFFILYYVLNGKWTPGINLFAFAKIIILILITVAVVMVIQLLTGIICALLQKRGETIVRLISSFIQYVAVLALIFTAFESLGIDTRALLASVGILSLAVSLGAKDLVADVLSGVTIAFSDEYQIGDYIEINGFRGWVQEIGVRATTLVNNDGNIKHFSNRDVKNILNLSRRNCQYTINVTIANDQSLRDVEEILERELPQIGENTPEIIRGPEYKGVKGFNAGSVTLEISAECKEHNYGKVRSQLNRSIRLILEENGIAIK
ncbi:MAG: mechanosensitive ion channel family protein [Clostridia bacterium]|nr:mechanosensitive ion channel family protein [Clostridia bacterium]